MVTGSRSRGGVCAAAGALLALMGGPSAFAAQPVPWQMGLQPAGTTVMTDIRWFESFTFWIVTLVVLFVAALLLVCIVRFSARANPVPSRTAHNTMIEVVWTVAPILILVIIAIPSFRLLYKELVIPEADLTLKVTGYQWYWGYEYTDEKYAGVQFESNLLDDASREKRMTELNLPASAVPRLLAVDNEVVVPVGKVVRIQTTAADVIHSFAVPSFGVKIDSIPGRLNEAWFRVDAPGIYYGQCSELCGSNHAFMPIAVRAVEPEQFEAWASAAKQDIDKANALLAQMLATASPKLAAR